ncbi:hypothetical protein V6N13_093594 [Hibiscus sabdariffa]
MLPEELSPYQNLLVSMDQCSHNPFSCWLRWKLGISIISHNPLHINLYKDVGFSAESKSELSSDEIDIGIVKSVHCKLVLFLVPIYNHMFSFSINKNQTHSIETRKETINCLPFLSELHREEKLPHCCRNISSKQRLNSLKPNGDSMNVDMATGMVLYSAYHGCKVLAWLQTEYSYLH